MNEHIIKNPAGFNSGYNSISEIGEQTADTGMNFGILNLKQNEKIDVTSDLESAYLLLNGSLTFKYDDTSYTATRSSLFDEAPIAIHFASNSKVTIEAKSDCELAKIQVINDQPFPTVVFDQNNMLAQENRGENLLNNTAYRIVRTIFDKRNRANANLVLGEVVNFPGAWSSYPPHHHPQPEIYHYRFTEPQGYGHGELGEDVFKIEHNSTLKILKNRDHAQVSAPGYGMYYIWMIRHLPNHPYTVPTFTKSHEWTQSDKANTRVWQSKTLTNKETAEIESI